MAKQELAAAEVRHLEAEKKATLFPKILIDSLKQWLKIKAATDAEETKEQVDIK